MFWKHHGILGINARNLLYIRPYNKKKAIKMADNKIKTKQFLSTRGIPVPKLFYTIKNHESLEKFDFSVLPSSFVLKPNNGYGGEGIIVITDKKNNNWITAGGKQISENDLKEHIRDILDGRFSIKNVSDTAFFEQRIQTDDLLGKYSYKGLPDIRIVVHNLIPVMAMLRLPTLESDGKANLHMGAVGVGIDIAKGEATYISYKNKIIDEIPGGLGKIKGIKIPYWEEMLHAASKVQLITNLGYLAVDIAIDKNSGPALLEINARAGLGVQIANLAKLRKRLQRIEGVKVTSPEKGVRIAKDMFGNVVEKEIQELSGKTVISTKEKIEIIKNKESIRLTSLVNTVNQRSILDFDTAKKYDLLNEKNYSEDKKTLKIKFSLKGNRIQTIVDLKDLSDRKEKMLLGSRDLINFLIDTHTPSKILETNKEKSEKAKEEPVSRKINYKLIDQQLCNLDSQIKLLYHLKPTNLHEEEEKFIKNPKYNPQFEYPDLKFDPIEITEKLKEIETDDSPLGILMSKKSEEILNKVKLIESIDEKRFSTLSKKLYGTPSKSNFEDCLLLLKKRLEEKKEKPPLKINDEEAKIEFEKIFDKYGLNNWKVSIKNKLVARCVAGKKNKLFIRKNAKFSEKGILELIVHEIETHILTAENGRKQSYNIFNRGLANYLITQEGLAMYNVNTQCDRKIYESSAIIHVLSIYKSLEHSFSEVYAYLRNLNITHKQALKSTIKCKRGFANTAEPGSFTKDFIYYEGYLQVKEYMDNGGDLKDLYYGKYNLEDLESIKRLNNLSEPLLLPKWYKKEDQ